MLIRIAEQTWVDPERVHWLGDDGDAETLIVIRNDDGGYFEGTAPASADEIAAIVNEELARRRRAP